MSENPYQPSQVVSGRSLGFRRILAVAAAYRSQEANWRYYGFRWQALLWLLLPFALWSATLIVFIYWMFVDDKMNIWLINVPAVPWFIFMMLCKKSGGVVLSPRVRESSSEQATAIRNGVLYASGVFTFCESDSYIKGTQRMINRLMTGRGPAKLFIRIPSVLEQSAERNEFKLYCGLDPLLQIQENNPDDETEFWYAAGRLDPQKEPECVYQHHGFNSEPAVKFHYFDEQQRPSWLVIASPDERYLDNTLASLRQSSMIASTT